MKVRVQHRVQRHTLFVASAQRFLYRHRKRLSENEFTMLMNEFLEVCSSHSSRTMLGQVCFADSAIRWRNEEFVHPDNTRLLSHQRNMLDHLLENEEIATLMALGLSFDYAPVVYNPLYEVNEFSYCCVRGITEFVLYSLDSPFQVLLGTTTNNLSNSIRFYVLAESAEQIDLVRLYGTGSIESLSQTPIVQLTRDLLLFVDLCSLNTRVEHRYLSWVQILHVTHVQCSNSFRYANREHYCQPVPESVILNNGASTSEPVSAETSAATTREERLASLRSRSGRLMFRPVSPLSRAANVAVGATLNPLTNITARHLARLSPYRRTVSMQAPQQDEQSSPDSWHDPARGLRREVREEPRVRPIRSRRFSVTPTRPEDLAQVVTVSVSANNRTAIRASSQPPVPVTQAESATAFGPIDMSPAPRQREPLAVPPSEPSAPPAHQWGAPAPAPLIGIAHQWGAPAPGTAPPAHQWGAPSAHQWGAPAPPIGITSVSQQGVSVPQGAPVPLITASPGAPVPPIAATSGAPVPPASSASLVSPVSQQGAPVPPPASSASPASPVSQGAPVPLPASSASPASLSASPSPAPVPPIAAVSSASPVSSVSQQQGAPVPPIVASSGAPVPPIVASSASPVSPVPASSDPQDSRSEPGTPPSSPPYSGPFTPPSAATSTTLSLRSSSSPDVSQPAYTRGGEMDLTTDEVIPPSPLLDDCSPQLNPFQNVFNGPVVNFPGRVTCDRCPNCPTPFCHITDRQSLSACVVPRSYLKTIIADSSGSGKTFTVISLCLQGDSRNNWVLVRSSQLPSWRYHCQQYSNCKFFVIASLNDVNVFFSMRGDLQDPALQYNIILVVTSMVTYTGNKAPMPYRLFVDDNDVSFMNVLSGHFNYVLASEVSPAINSFAKSNFTNLIQTHDSCVETLFDLPPIVFSCQCISRPSNNWSFSGIIDFCIDLNPGNDANNSALFRHVLFSHEYDSINKLLKTIRLGQRDIQELQKRLPNPESDTNIQSMLAIVNMKEREMNEIQGNIQYQIDRVLTGNCIICLSRDHDYVVTHCCRNNICCDCLIKIDLGVVGKRRCPYCRQEHDARNSRTPVLLQRDPGVPRMSKHFAITPVQEAVTYITNLVSSYREHNSTCISSDNRNWCVSHPLKIVMCANTNMSVVNDLLSDVIKRFRTHHLKQLSIFQSTPEPAVLLISNTNKAIFYDLPFVTHVVLVGEVNPILAQSLLTRVNRYGRKNPLQVQQFISVDNISIREYLVSRGKDCPRVLRDIVSENSTYSYLVLDNYE